MPASPTTTEMPLQPVALADAPWLGGEGMGARMRGGIDWRATPLGAPETWPQSLRSALSICLGSRFPMVVLWGPQLTMLYNDAYAPLLGDKHPAALGRSIDEVWQEVAEVIAPLMDSVLKTGEATWIPDGFLALERHGAPEETYFSYSFGPVRVEDGSVGGILAVTIETTERVVSERRLAFLRALDEATSGCADAGEVCARAMAEVGRGTPDILQAAIHLNDAALAGEAPVAQSAAGEAAAGGPRLQVPIQTAEKAERLGTLELVLNPLRPVDAAYRAFVAAVGRQIARALAEIKALALERARVDSEMELRRIFEQAPSFVCIMKGPSHVFEFVNRAHEQLFNSGGWLGKPVREAFPDIASQGYYERLDEVYGTGRRFIAASAPVRYRYDPHSTEEERLLDFIYEPIRDQAGRITGIFCEGFDVTAQRRAEAALREQRRLYEAILNNTPDLAYVFDLSHRFVYANEGLLRMWGKSWDEAIGKTCLELGYEPWHAEMHNQEIDLIARTRKPIRGEVPFSGAFGRRVYDYILVPVIGEQGDVIAVAGTTRDVTERKEMEETLRTQADRLREGDQRKDEFLGMLAHELRNPLAPLRNGLAVIRRLAAPEATQIQSVRAMMDRQVAQMVRLIDDLLDVTRISSGKIRISKERVALAEVVQAAVETSQPAIDQAGHRLSISPPREAVFVEADPTRLAQVFANLLTNAAKFTPAGGHIEISTEPLADEDEVSVTVRDNGEGLGAEMLSRIFEMFFQVDRRLEREKSGLGIGLFLARGLVTLHGGRIEARSEGPGRGSAFVVRLPVAGPLASADSAGRDAKAGTQQQQLLPPRRVLLADDNVDAAQSMAALLELMGAEMHVVHNGLDAVAAARTFRPAVVILDIGMPGLNGYEACEQIKALPEGPGMLVVALTGWGQDKDRQRAREAGFDGHLVKPVSPDAVAALIASLDAPGTAASPRA